MNKIIGFGGIFFKAKDPKKLAAWYQEFLGIEFGGNEYTELGPPELSNPKNSGKVVFSFFKAESDYFQPSQKEFMINLRVDDLASMIAQLQKEKINVLGEMQEYEYGKFAWIMDPEGNKIELWEEK